MALYGRKALLDLPAYRKYHLKKKKKKASTLPPGLRVLFMFPTCFLLIHSLPLTYSHMFIVCFSKWRAHKSKHLIWDCALFTPHLLQNPRMVVPWKWWEALFYHRRVAICQLYPIIIYTQKIGCTSCDVKTCGQHQWGYRMECIPGRGIVSAKALRWEQTGWSGGAGGKGRRG